MEKMHPNRGETYGIFQSSLGAAASQRASPSKSMLVIALLTCQVKRIVRPTDVPDTGLICDFLWADPDKD